MSGDSCTGREGRRQSPRRRRELQQQQQQQQLYSSSSETGSRRSSSGSGSDRRAPCCGESMSLAARAACLLPVLPVAAAAESMCTHAAELPCARADLARHQAQPLPASSDAMQGPVIWTIDDCYS